MSLQRTHGMQLAATSLMLSEVLSYFCWLLGPCRRAKGVRRDPPCLSCPGVLWKSPCDFFNFSNTCRCPFRKQQLPRANPTPHMQLFLFSKQVSARDQPLSRDLKPPGTLGTEIGLFRATPAAGQSPDQLHTAHLRVCCGAGRGPTGSCTSQELPHFLEPKCVLPRHRGQCRPRWGRGNARAHEDEGEGAENLLSHCY